MKNKIVERIMKKKIIYILFYDTYVYNYIFKEKQKMQYYNNFNCFI